MPGFWRHWWEDLGSARASLGVFFLLLVIQLAVAGSGGWEAHGEWVERFGLSWDGLKAGRLWQPASYALLHGGWWHAGLNLAGWLALAPRLERIGGARLVMVVGGGAVLGGAAGHLAFADGRILIGASAAVFGMLLWLTGVSPGSRMWPLPVSGRSLGWGTILASAILAGWNPGILSGVSHGCHLGGALTGWWLARWTLRPRVTREQLQRERARRESRDGDRF